MKYKLDLFVWSILRICMGWVFFWAFLDKMFGLGFSTAPDAAWIAGGSPTFGFLSFATKGTFASFYQSLAGNPLIDWLFMAGLMLIGLCLLLGIGVKIACYSGILMFLLMYTAGFIPPEHNPLIDEHIINSIVLIGLSIVPSGKYLGLGKWWKGLNIVKKNPILA